MPTPSNSPQRAASPATARNAVDVVVPVYNAPADVARCVESVLAHTSGAYRLVLIDDASPDPAVAAHFAELERRALPHVVLERNEANLGFTATANRALQASRSDVVLLNSDTIVTAGWLDALARCVASDPRIGTATPFSNNAEICSFPQFCVDNPWPDGADPEPVRAALARAAVPTYPDLPTGVGFCLYIRRALIDAIGVFDPAFGLGYGEENDYCLRAVQAGFRNVLCDDAFVVHAGERSFAGRKAELGTRNMELLLARHPRYLDLVRAFIAADPLRPLRTAALAQQRAASGGPGVLHVVHGHGGGTLHHVRALIGAAGTRYRHLLAVAVGDLWQVEEYVDDGVQAFAFRRREDEPWPAFVGGLCATFGVALIHLHNVSGCRDGILAALSGLRLPYGYTVHDLNFACPTITFLGADGMYCGAQTDPAVCGRCLAAQPEFAALDIAAWRARHRTLLANAEFLIAPSAWTARTLKRYFPDHGVEVIAHGTSGDRPEAAAPGSDPGSPPGSARLTLVLPDDDAPSVAVLGAIGPDKGARRLERLVELVRRRGLRLRFVLIGYLDCIQSAWQSDDAVFTIHGRYAPRDLPDLLAHYRVRLVAYPSACPETFSYTLSEAWAAGRPVVVPPIGTLAERVDGTGAGWVWSEDEWRDESQMLDRIAALVAPQSAAALAAAARRARELPLPSITAMAQCTLAVYDDALARTAASGRNSLPPPLAAARVRDALGYASWTPPAEPLTAAHAAADSVDARTSGRCSIAPEPRGGARGRLTDIVLRWRRSLPARVLIRLTPNVLRDALKARLF
jgi:GT2 family glycosyltransferase/glycosyltransferase involved in cell wall biosynthesis